MAQNGLFLQRLADILELPILRPQMAESTAFGAAFLAGVGQGLYASIEDIRALWQPELRCTPQLEAGARSQQLQGWRDAVRRVLSGAGARDS